MHEGGGHVYALCFAATSNKLYEWSQYNYISYNIANQTGPKLIMKNMKWSTVAIFTTSLSKLAI